MTEVTQSISLPGGIPKWSRDIVLERLQLANDGLLLRGRVESLGKAPEKSLRMAFNGVLAFTVLEYDFVAGTADSLGFDEIHDSDWVRELAAIDSAAGGSHKIRSAHRHFRLSTYDWVLDVICVGYELQEHAGVPGEH